LESAISKLTEALVNSIPKNKEADNPIVFNTTDSYTCSKDAPTAQCRIPGPHEVIDKYLNRERRKCNLIVRNLPEPQGQSACKDLDIKSFKEIINSELEIDPNSIEVVKAIRVGNQTKKPRLLLVTINDEVNRTKILRNAYKLKNSAKWPNLYISADMTLREREINLQNELKLRKSNSETNLYIKMATL